MCVLNAVFISFSPLPLFFAAACPFFIGGLRIFALFNRLLANMIKKILTVGFAVCIAVISSMACTSAVVSGKITRNGRPLLWKHRDTGTLDNFVQRVDSAGSEYGFVALFNSHDHDCEQAWIGVNDKGFAIMNTASYNLAPDTASYKDMEGYIMARALKRCRSVKEFAAMLDTLPKPLGVQANFGVIDAYGDGGYFETDDYGYEFFPVSGDEPLLVRTNFSVSGGDGGLGHVRYDNAVHLLAPYVKSGDISPEVFTDELSRSFYYSPDGVDMSQSGLSLILDKDFIPRYSTSASVVIEGVTGEDGAGDVVMWTLMGYPPCGHVEAVTLDEIPSDLLPRGESGRCLAGEQAVALKDKIFINKGSRGRYVKTGVLNAISAEQKAVSLENYRKFRKKKASSE